MIPDTSIISLLSDDPNNLRKKVEKEYKKVEFQNYNSLLENIPAKIYCAISGESKNIEILDNRGSLVAATKVADFHVVNLQYLMNDFLARYMLYDEEKEEKIKYIWGYLQCFNLVNKASDNYDRTNACLLPAHTVFGNSNINKANIILEHNILRNIGERSNNCPPERPINFRPMKEFNCKIQRSKVDKFKIQDSWIFEIDNAKRDKPLEYVDR